MVDVSGQVLFVGDIVITSTIDKMGICSNNGLTVVVSDRYKTFSDGTHEEKENDIKYYIMGIKNIDIMQKSDWIVKRVKSNEDVINGEHWRDFGFNYKEI